jgi:uncharacterized protein (DUF1015 family)
MVNIKPFPGVRYTPTQFADLSPVISQPHDRINPDLQEQYYKLSPYNITRVTKGKEYLDDNDVVNVYTRARKSYQLWLREGILFQEATPALYVTHQIYTLPDGSQRTRKGLIAALAVTPYEERVVLPHEQILPKSMEDRIHLIEATAANFGSIFMLYPGTDIDALLQPALTQQPPLEFRELLVENDVRQQFWAVTDIDVINAVVGAMAAKPNLIVADGHHRYQTAVYYRDEMRKKYPNAPANAAFNYRLVTLVSMDDPGLVILPTHRLIKAGLQLSQDEILQRAGEYFEITALADRATLEAALKTAKASTRPTFGLYNGNYTLLTLRNPEIMARLLSDRDPAWRELDVSVLHELFIERVLGIDKQAVALKEKVNFIRTAEKGYAAVNQGQADCLLVMNATRIEQVQACTAAGERMPQKSTDFYPKMLNGVVMMKVVAEDRL